MIIDSQLEEDCILYGDQEYIVDCIRGHYIKEDTKSLVNDLDNLSLDNELIRKSNEFLSSMSDIIDVDKIRRGRKWKMLTYYCLDNTYNTLNNPQSPQDICKLINLPLTNVSKIHKEILHYKIDNITNVNPDIFVYKYCTDLSLIDDIDGMLAINDYIEGMIDDYPQVIAAGIISFYCTRLDKTLDKIKLQKLAGKSIPTINKIVKVLNKLFI